MSSQRHLDLAGPWYPAVNERGNPVVEVFEGSIPCGPSESKGCEKIKVALVFYQGAAGQ